MTKKKQQMDFAIAVIEMVTKFPNNMELGSAVRSMFHEKIGYEETVDPTISPNQLKLFDVQVKVLSPEFHEDPTIDDIVILGED
jgi:hypothetical protein|tara:strand:- start:1012 stop:1263 length:252 start_codon:yes stop_codon:yes gene_type:complete